MTSALNDKPSANPATQSVPITGELSIYTALELKTTLLDALHANPALKLNLANVTVMDGAGLQVLVMLKREALQLNKELTLTQHSEAVLRVLDLSNMTGYFGDPLVLCAEASN
ncbi:STAS domain-containing protein [Uliginosibacterium gangwonense]|uniref:STAS domain-containing protein n=1 Tax=Uliginosibacterium gangwonense TaxID=392736 RepID=UPI00037439AC|nr:STAS domain-containing protein [Uliginosibacterium gangwonense]